MPRQCMDCRYAILVRDKTNNPASMYLNCIVNCPKEIRQNDLNILKYIKNNKNPVDVEFTCIKWDKSTIFDRFKKLNRISII